MKNNENKTILALGAESAGNFSFLHNGKTFHSENFGDLLSEENFDKFKKSVLGFIKKEGLVPDIIITDLHPLYVTTIWGKELAKKFRSNHIEVQHHIAHTFSQLGKSNSKLNDAHSIVLDGTGYGLDENIWGGEVFEIKNNSAKRIGHLESQILIGGDLAIREPARVLIGILGKFLGKKETYEYIKKYYNKNQFELLWNQLQEKFNCQETSSAGRILDAASVLLGFSKNERKEKHGATHLLEKNSTTPYSNLKPQIKNNILLTTPLFEYLVQNINKDKKRLAATAQLYIAQGLHEIVKKHNKNSNILLSGGLSENKIIKEYFTYQKVLENKKSHVPVGDAGISFGQLTYYILTNPRD